MFGTRRRQNGTYHAIGVDLGADAVKLLQLRTPLGGVTEVAAAARVRLPQVPGLSPHLAEAATLTAIRESLRASGFVGRRVVAALPRRIVQLRTVRITPSNATDFDPLTAAETEAAQLFSFPLDAARVAYLPAGEVRHAGEAQHEVIAAAAADADVTEFLELLGRAGLQVAALELEQSALCRVIERSLASDGGKTAEAVHVLLDVGASATQIIIGRGGDLRVSKTVSTGVNQIEQIVSRRLSVSPEDVRQLRSRLGTESPGGTEPVSRANPVRQALYDAMRVATADVLEQALLCLRYYTVSFRGRPPAKVWLTGGGAEGADLCELARVALGLPVEPLPLLAGVPLGPLVALDNTNPLGEWAVAYGLALQGIAQPHAAGAAAGTEVVHA